MKDNFIWQQKIGNAKSRQNFGGTNNYNRASEILLVTFLLIKYFSSIFRFFKIQNYRINAIT